MGLAALGAVAGLAALGGCKGDSQFSKQESAEIKQGPPREMPPQAQQMMRQAKGSVPSGPQGSATR
jgi:hypothetical protein